mgnify:CR=1 FL=1
MQYQLPLVTFQYQEDQRIRTLTINGEPWFYASDVCAVLGISNPSNVYSRLDADDLHSVEVIDVMGRKQKTYAVSEFGLYDINSANL